MDLNQRACFSASILLGTWEWQFMGYVTLRLRERAAGTSGRGMETMTAQDHLKALLREEVAPRLREHGLRGTERIFTLASARFFAQMGFQSSTSSTRDLAKFTVNLQVIERAEWASARRQYAWLPPKPNPNSMYAAPVGGWGERIGTLVNAHDTWWALDAQGTGRDQVANEVVHAISNYGLPAMRARMA